MKRIIKIKLYTIIVMAFFFAWGGLVYADTVLGTGKLKDTILLPGPNARKVMSKDKLKKIENAFLQRGKGRAGFQKKRYRRKLKVELVRVIPKRGNNPLNSTDPIRNTYQNGQVLSRAVDEQECGVSQLSEPTSPQGNPSGCVKNASMQVVATPPPLTVWGANFDIDPDSLNCRTPPPGVVGQGNFSITYAMGDPANTMYCAGSAANPNSEWKLQQGGHCKGYPPNQVVQFIAISNSGRLLQVTFKVDTSGAPPVLQVISLTALN